MKPDTMTPEMLDLLTKQREVTTQIKNLYKTKVYLENQIRDQQILDSSKHSGDRPGDEELERSMRGTG